MLVLAFIAQPSVRVLGHLPHDSQRTMQVAAYAFVASWALAQPELRRRMGELVARAPRIWTSLALVFGVGIASSWMAASPWTGALEVSLLAGTLLVMLVIAAEVSLNPRPALTACLLGVTAATALQLAPLAGGIDLSDGAYELWMLGGLGTGGFSNVRFLNQFQTLALPVMGALAASDRPAYRWAARVILAASAWSLVVTEARGAVLSLAVVTIALVAVRRAGRRRWAMAFLPPVLAGATLGAASRRLADIPGLLVSSDRLASGSGRLTLWMRAWDQSLDEPILGVGPGHLAHVDEASLVVAVDAGRATVTLAHPHNTLLTMSAEWGIPAAVVVLTLLAILGIAALVRPADPLVDRVASVDGAVVRTGVTASVGAALALSMLSGVTVMPVALTGLALLAGVLLAHQPPGTPSRRRADRIGGAAAVVLALSVAILLVEVIPTSAADIDRSGAVADELIGEQVRTPRFWSQGIRGPAEP